VYYFGIGLGLLGMVWYGILRILASEDGLKESPKHVRQK
jgi:hypothetical protein